MSEEEKIKDYSWGLQLGLILGIYAISLAISIIFIYKVSRKKISKAIFVLSSIYSSLFVYLNLMAIFDLFFNNHEGFHKLFKFLKKFYFGFTIVDKALGFFLFNLLIYYLESGYFSNMKRFSDGLRRFCHSMKKLTCCKIAIILAIAIPIVGTLLVLLIIYRKHYDLGVNPLNYSDILFDCYAVFEIYTGVGFFIYQLIKDCKKIDDENLIKRYYRYSTKIIIKKVNKYIKSINDAYEYLNKLAPIFENDNSNPYHQYLQKYYNKIKQTKLELEGNNNGNKVIIILTVIIILILTIILTIMLILTIMPIPTIILILTIKLMPILILIIQMLILTIILRWILMMKIMNQICMTNQFPLEI